MLTQLPSLYVYENINYVLKLKSPCKAVTTANIALLSGPITIDDVALVANDRILLVGQINTINNGIWVINAGAWTRPDDFAVGASASSAYSFIDQGTVYKDTGWLCVSDSGADVVGTNELVFIQFSSAGQLTFTNGVTKVNFTVSNDLITGKAGGQTIIGGTLSGESLILKGSSHADNGPVRVQSQLIQAVGLPAITPSVPSSVWFGSNSITVPDLATNATNAYGIIFVPSIQATGNIGTKLVGQYIHASFFGDGTPRTVPLTAGLYIQSNAGFTNLTSTANYGIYVASQIGSGYGIYSESAIGTSSDVRIPTDRAYYFGPADITGFKIDVAGGAFRLARGDGAAYSALTVSGITIPDYGLGASAFVGANLKNATLSTVGAPVQYSPGLMWTGTAFDTDDTTSRKFEWLVYEGTVSGASPYSILYFVSRTDEGAWGTRLGLTSGGNLTATGAIYANIQGAANGPSLGYGSNAGFFFAGGNTIGATTNGVERLNISSTGAFTFTPAVSDANGFGISIGGTVANSGAGSTSGVVLNSNLTGYAGANARMIQITPTITFNGGNPTVTASYGIHIAAGSKTGSGTITTAYGAYIDAPTIGTNNYALWTNGYTFINASIGVAGTAAFTGRMTLTPAAVSSGSNASFTFTAAAHTGQTASTEVTDVLYDMSAVKTWAAGNIATQRDIVFKPRTYAFAGPGTSTVNIGATVAIEGAPIVGANAAISNARSLWVQNGHVQFDGSSGTLFMIERTGIGTAQTTDLWMRNTTPATVGAPVQYTPCIFLRGNAWDTDDGGSGMSQPVDWLIQGQPTSGTSVAGNLVFMQRLNNGAWSQKLTVDVQGALWTTGVVAGGEGSAQYPTIRKNGQNAGLYFPGNTDVAISTSSAERFRISSTGAVTFTTANNAAGAQYGIDIGGTVTSTDNYAMGLRVNTGLVPGATSRSYGIWVGSTVTAPVGTTVTSHAGLWISALAKSGTGTVTTAYGLYVAAPTAGATNYAAYIDGYTHINGALVAGASFAFAQGGTGNLYPSGTVVGTNAAKNIILSNAATAPSNSIDSAHLYAADCAGAGTTAFALWQEDAPIAAAGVASTHKIAHVVNGVTYYFLATTVR